MGCLRAYTMDEVSDMYHWCVRHNRYNLPVGECVKSTLRETLLYNQVRKIKGYTGIPIMRKVWIGLFEYEWKQVDACMRRNPE